MTKVISTGNRTGKSKTYETLVTCGSCGQQYSSLEVDCPHCRSNGQLKYSAKDVKRTGKVLEGDDLAKVKGGNHLCPWCNKPTWNYDAEKRHYVCANGCGGNTGEGPSDYVLAGGQEVPKPQSFIPTPTSPAEDSTKPTEINWKLIGGIAAGVVVIILFVWFIAGLFTTHNVNGSVESVSWVRKSHQTTNTLMNGSGFGLPANATAVGTPESKIARYHDNVVSTEQPVYYVTSTQEEVGHTNSTYYIDSTPEVVGHTHSTIQIETPGAIYTSEPYDCGEPTEEAGGSVSYDQCTDTLQEDSTYGEGESEETPVYAPVVPVKMTSVDTPVYADPVNVKRTALPTNIYGTPTPEYEDYYWYTYWEWINTGNLEASGYDNNPQWPAGIEDDKNKVINDSEQYQVIVKYDNGDVETYNSSDPVLLQKYILNELVVGKFNIFGGFAGDDQ